MKILNLTQGSPEWHAARARCFTASEAPAMMGASSKVRRTELLHMKATGTEREISDWVQKHLFHKGHEYEAAARPLVEALIGDELFPATATDDDGELLASFDGMTMDEATLFEHKMWNEELAEAVRQQTLTPEYFWQLEQQLLVSGAERVIFVCSDGTKENFVHLEYRPVPGRAAQLRAGWAQFKADLADYTPAAPKADVVAAPVMALPAIQYTLNGLALTSNMEVFRAAAERLVEDSKTPLETDQDFANREALNKAFKEAEDKIGLIREQVIGEIQDVDAFCRELGHIGELIRQSRLNGEKQVKARKEAIRQEIQRQAEWAFQSHVDAINQRLGKVRVPDLRPDIAGAMKGKKTLASLRDAADTAAAKAKIEVELVARKIETNLATLRELAGGLEFLFADAQQLVTKEHDDLVRLIQARITEHQAKEAARIEVERERIRREEQARLERAAMEAQASAARAEAARLREQAAAAPAAQAAAEPVRPMENQTGPKETALAAAIVPTAAMPPAFAIPAKAAPDTVGIINVLAREYGVTPATAAGWLFDLDLDVLTHYTKEAA